ncbi:MAG TPA: PQQ-dependent sugar dehydrogenase [Ohtaekwangia sp.]|nr:PQQ-dependent sugar dehydrogenase [Ohtaekwangia sp.]
MKYLTILTMGALLALSGACDDDDGDDGQDENISLNLVTDGLVSPLVLVESPDNTDRLFVVDQPGQIYVIKDDERLTTPFLDIQSKLVARQGAQDERGLLGLAFHPDYASNGRLFVFYSGPLREEGPEGWDHTNYVAEYHVSGNADQGDIASERIILAMDHPQPNHNAGMIAFGSDGYLYISTGDGGGGDDVDEGHVDDWYEANEGGNGQDITQNLLGSILRIDVSPTEGYAIPADNPFVDTDGLDEIFAYGLRNPYRFCFGPDNNIILADAGQELYEEIDLVEKGGNYGWNVKEGAHCFSTANPDVPPGDCPTEDDLGNALIDPVIEFKNSKSFSDGLGNVSIGGYVYQDDEVPSLDGKYIFGVLTQDSDAMNGAIFAADRSGDTWDYEKISFNNLDDNELNMFVLGFGQDNDGEVYVLTSSGSANSGAVYKIDD